MARFVNIQTNFTSGELDPLVRARIDLKSYNNALDTAKNVVCQPQGGIARRPGTKFINEIVGSPANGVRLIPFEFSTADHYMLCFTNDTLYVYKNKALVHTQTGTGIVSAYLGSLCWTQSADTLIVAQEDMAPRKIVRNSDTSWTISTIAFNSIPKHAFTLSTSNPAGTLTPSDVSGKITLTASSAVFSSGNVGQYINAAPQGRARVVEVTSSTTLNVVTEFPFFDTSVIANGSWSLETGYESVWSNGKGWPRTVVFHQGRLYFGGSKSRPSTVWGSKVSLFFSFEAVEGLDDDAVESTLDTNTFNAVTDMVSGKDLQVFTTGGEFFVPQEGLSPITPSNLFFSTTSVNGSKEGVRVKQLESGTLFVQRQGKALSEIAYSDTTLSYITSKISLLSGHLLKGPKRMDIRRAVATDENDLLLIVNEDDGSMAAYSLLRAQNVIAPSEFITDGSYIDVGVDITDIYTVTTRAVGPLINATIKVTDYANIAVGTKLTFTKNDGTVITLQSESVGGGSPSSPSGNTHFFKPNTSNNVTADNIYTALNAVSGFTVANPAANTVSVARDIAGINNLIVTTTDSTRLAKTNFSITEKYYVEVFDETLLTDCGIVGGSGTSASVAHLKDKVVNLVVDGNVELDQTVPSGGSVTFTTAAAVKSEVGIPISVEIKTMPVEVAAQGGTRLGFRKRVLEVNAILYETQNIVINGNLVPIRSLGSGLLDSSVAEFTGIKTLHGILGYSQNAQITVTQNAPLKLTLLGLEYKVSVYQGG
tara:strand:+ start:547 stop:2838 length:2292 start_codon:yes stop_codon:yes gene_type:complete